MEELIEILINLIANWMRGNSIKSVRPGGIPTGNTPARQAPPTTATGARKPASRKPGRRPMIQTIAVAQPIVTGTASPVVSASTGTKHAVPAKSIADNAAVNSKPSASAISLRKWLTPSTLRQQFMLTEILRPPLSLREDHQS